MSIAVHVFLHSSRLPGAEEWNAAIKAEGFNLTLDPFDLRTDDGYRPAMLKSEESGFEWSLSQNDHFHESPERLLVSGCDLNASLTFGSRGDEHVAACIAGAVLAKMTDGFHLDVADEGKLLRGEEAISLARSVLAEWLARSQAPAKLIAAATTSILAPALKELGFVRVKPLEFARREQGIVQTVWVGKRDEEFRCGGTSEALYPLHEFMPGKFSPSELDNWHGADSKEKADAAMQNCVAALREHLFPWFEDTKTDPDYLDYMLEFYNHQHHDLFQIGCLQAKLGRTAEAVDNLNQAVLQYERDGRDWCWPQVALCRELLTAVTDGTAQEVLERWKVQSLQNLGFKKLLLPPRDAAIEKSNGPGVPPPIPTGHARTAALFSRELVRPSAEAVIKRALPGFRLIEQRGSECRFSRAGSAGMFDFVVVSRSWQGAIKIELASSYDSRGTREFLGLGHTIGLLGHSIGLAGLKHGMTPMQLNYRDVWHKNFYTYGRSAEELQRQLRQLAVDLTKHAPIFFLAARQILQARKLVQFALSEVFRDPPPEHEKDAFTKELAIANRENRKPIATRYTQLIQRLQQFAAPHLEIPKEERDDIDALARQLLTANLSAEAAPSGNRETGKFWKWFRRR